VSGVSSPIPITRLNFSTSIAPAHVTSVSPRHAKPLRNSAASGPAAA
jgi:hypothetical protein